MTDLYAIFIQYSAASERAARVRRLMDRRACPALVSEWVRLRNQIDFLEALR